MDYNEHAPTRTEIDDLAGPVVVDFGTNWCGYCRGALPLIEGAMRAHPRVSHIKVEDGPGRSLGRSFKVKLWPTLIFLRDGQERARAVRPQDRAEIERGLALIDQSASA